VEERTRMKRAVLYMRVSTVDQHPETQMYDLRQLAAQRGYQIVNEYTDIISGSKAKRPGLDQMLDDAHRGKFDVVLVWAFDRVAILRDRYSGMSLTDVANTHRISRAMVSKIVAHDRNIA